MPLRDRSPTTSPFRLSWFFLTCWLLSIAVSCSQGEVATDTSLKKGAQPADDAKSAPADGTIENATGPRDDAKHHTPASGHAPHGADAAQARVDQHQCPPEQANQDHAPPVQGDQHQPSTANQHDATKTDHEPSTHARDAPHRSEHSAATGTGIRVTTVPVPEGGRPVAAKTGADGSLHLLYGSADGPQYAKSTDNGRTFGAPLAVVDQASRKPGLEFDAWDMAVGPGGVVHVALGTNAWKLKLPQEEWGYYYARLEPGAKAFSKLRNINRTPSEGFSLACDEKGKVTACWLKDKLYANVSLDNGKTFADNAEIDASFDPCNCCTTSSIYGADGKLAVLYREETNNERDMFLVSWDQERNQVSRTRVSSTLWKIEACPMSYYTISRDQEGFVAVWPTKDEIFFARLDGQGKPLPPKETKTPGKSGMRTGIIALSAPDGSSLVAWKKDEQLGWQLYDGKGRPSGSPGSAPSSGSGVAGVVDDHGDFILFR